MKKNKSKGYIFCVFVIQVKGKANCFHYNKKILLAMGDPIREEMKWLLFSFFWRILATYYALLPEHL